MSNGPRRMPGFPRGLARVLAPSKHDGRFDAGDLKTLADAMVAEVEADQAPETEVDNEVNSGISAGCASLGPFIDHDLTFAPDARVDFHTPRFDCGSRV